MKKIYISLLIMLGIMCTSATAFALTDGDWEFRLLDDEVMITGYLGDNENIVIPSTLFGAPVTKIDAKFKNAASIVMPDTVREVSDKMCQYNENLESVIFSNNIEVLGNDLRYMYGSCMFQDCVNLTTVKLPENLKRIGATAFLNCKSLKNITLPDSLEEIGESAFEGCESLTSLNIPPNLKIMEDSAFEDSGLESVNIPGSVSWDVYTNRQFEGCTNLKNATIGEGITVLPEYLFSECTSLKHVELPGTITEIARGAFFECASLEELTLPVSLRIINQYAFYGTGLRQLVLPYGVEYINGQYTFAECPDLEAVFIPDSLTKIEGSIHSTMFENSGRCIVYCSADSYMANYCKDNNISYLTDNSVNSSITVYYNGTRISFHEYGQNPELINDRTLVPLRAIFEAMGADVKWDQETETVTSTRNGVTIKLTIGDNVLYKNGQSIPVDVPAQIVNDRTLVPARVVAEAFGADVQWNEASNSVLITE